MPAKTPIRVGIIGANWGLSHVEAWRAVSGVDVAAICTSNRGTAEAAATKMGIPRAIWEVAEMLSDPSLDIIDVTPRPSIRVPLALRALQLGKHLLQPIPFALDLTQGRLLRDTAKSRGLVAVVENLHRHSPVFRQAKDLIDSGMLGEVLTINGHVRTGILLNPAAGYSYEWITKAESGASALRNFGAHLIHTLEWLFGEITAVSSDISTKLNTVRFDDGSSTVNETADSAALLVQYRTGASGLIDTSWCTTAGEGFLIDAVGIRGRIVIRADGLGPQNAQLLAADSKERNLSLRAIQEHFLQNSGVLIRDDPQHSRRYPMAAMCRCVADAVRNSNAAQAHPTFDEAYRVMNVVEAAYRSAETRSWVAVNPDSA